MTAALKRLVGADRPKAIAVVGLTRADVEAGVAHARTAGEALPIRTWCAEETSAWAMRRELGSVWPALILVSWTGRRGDVAFKALPLTVPPFRVVVFNESRGFFPARPGPLAKHFRHRLSVALRDGAKLAGELAVGVVRWIWSLVYRTGERVRDVLMLGWSLVYRFAERFQGYGQLAVEIVLAVAAFVAQITPGWVRAKYGRLPVDVAAPVPLEPAAGTSFVEIAVNGRGWPRRAVLRAKADFVVFRRPGEKALAEPLIRLAVEQNAFAVARQLAYTGWRARVTTKHPFRRLLPGEVSRVLMPFSSLMVMRRDAMSVPWATTFGAALMAMFHEGGSGLVLGHADPITQEPAMPLEDLEFVMRSKTQVQSDLARGNVVTSPLHARPFRGLPRVLVVSPYLPFPLSHGGAVRIYNICRALRGKVDFVLACFREVNETVRYPELHEVFREVYTVDIDEKNADATVPVQIAHYRNTAMAALVRELARRVDIVQLEYTQMAEYRACAEARPTILVEHDITFTLYQQLGRDYEIWERFESEALRAVDVVWTMSGRDRELAIEHGAARESTMAVPNGVDLRRFEPQARETAGHCVLLVGSFRHLPNLLAFEALRETIMPVVWARFPECRLHVIAGPDHEKWARLAGKGKLLAADARITIQGFVEDVRPAYRECDVVAIPLPVSAGTNIKLMEAMACGRAIVSTAVGCQGLELENGGDLLVAEVGPEFAEALGTLLADDSKREQMAARARRTAEARFDWDRIARDALLCYANIKKAETEPCSLREETLDV
jgi:glycosyltransferase involved in cell wall biosynthesis